MKHVSLILRNNDVHFVNMLFYVIFGYEQSCWLWIEATWQWTQSGFCFFSKNISTHWTLQDDGIYWYIIIGSNLDSWNRGQSHKFPKLLSLLFSKTFPLSFFSSSWRCFIQWKVCCARANLLAEKMLNMDIFLCFNSEMEFNF